MTGLSLERDALIEVAVLVTDSQLRVLGAGINVVIACSPTALAQMPEVVREMHTKSGLLNELPEGISMVAAEQQILEYLRQHVPTAGKAPLAGNSVGTDRGFLARDMPQLVDHLHYRIIDVSSIKELARRWFPRAYFNAPSKAGGHRALADIQESIRELRYYRSVLFVPDPGPDSESARRAAAVILSQDA